MDAASFDFRRMALVAGIALILGGISTGCVATRKFTRARVNEKGEELSVRIDTAEKTLQGGIEANTGGIQANTAQIGELNSIARDHTGKIATLDGSVKQVDEKSQHALAVGEGAQNTATNAVAQVSSLGRKFENRNNFTVLSEEKVQFKFNNATIEKSYLPTLDALAQRVKADPDAILVMEGHTDATGPLDYNIRLGEKRIEAVIRYLVVNQGVPMHKVYRMSYGEEQPINPNNTREARAENRAVVIRIMGPSFSGTGQEMISSTPPTEPAR